jgi:hypothetical protein
VAEIVILLTLAGTTKLCEPGVENETDSAPA